jgi:hypothetical protein
MWTWWINRTGWEYFPVAAFSEHRFHKSTEILDQLDNRQLLRQQTVGLPRSFFICLLYLLTYYKRGKVDRAWSWPLASVWCQGQEWVEQYLHFPYIFMTWCKKGPGSTLSYYYCHLPSLSPLVNSQYYTGCSCRPLCIRNFVQIALGL